MTETALGMAWTLVVTPNEFTIMLVLTVFALPFVFGPYNLYRRGSQALYVGMHIVDDDARSNAQGVHSSDLNDLGFVFVGYLARSAPNFAAKVLIAMFINAENSDLAEIIMVADGTTSLDVLVFKARFDDGFAFEVGNSDIAPHSLGAGPQFPAFNFPQVRLTADLYRIHRKIKEGFATARRPIIADGKGELAEFIRKAEEVHRWHMAQPDFKLSASGDRYEYTLPGAVRRAWLQTWPINAIHKLHARKDAKKHARELGISILPN